MPLTTTATWPTLTNRTASAADVNSKFNWLEGDRLPMNSGALTTGAYDIGSSFSKWGNGYFSSHIEVSSATLTSQFVDKRIRAAAWVFKDSLGTITSWAFQISSIISDTTATSSFIMNFTSTISTAAPMICERNPGDWGCSFFSLSSLSVNVRIPGSSADGQIVKFNMIIAGEN